MVSKQPGNVAWSNAERWHSVVLAAKSESGNDNGDGKKKRGRPAKISQEAKEEVKPEASDQGTASKKEKRRSKKTTEETANPLEDKKDKIPEEQPQPAETAQAEPQPEKPVASKKKGSKKAETKKAEPEKKASEASKTDDQIEETKKVVQTEKPQEIKREPEPEAKAATTEKVVELEITAPKEDKHISREPKTEKQKHQKKAPKAEPKIEEKPKAEVKPEAELEQKQPEEIKPAEDKSPDTKVQDEHKKESAQPAEPVATNPTTGNSAQSQKPRDKTVSSKWSNNPLGAWDLSEKSLKTNEENKNRYD
jgi:hypothetical protein